MDKEKNKKDLEDILYSDEEYKDFKINYIIHYKDNDNYEAVVSNNNDIASVFLYNKKIEPIIELLYSIDNDVFETLERLDTEIIYATVDFNYSVWNYINEYYPDDINNKYGMNKYLKYCKENNITKELIEKEVKTEVPDVMKYYKNREVKILGTWETDYADIAVNALLMENNKKIANIITTFNLSNYFLKRELYDDFDYYKSLPKISKCSKLLQVIYDNVCESESSMCHITAEDWEEYYSDNFTNKDIEKLKEEVKEYKLDNVITFDDAEYKIIGWSDLETRFNDDRNFVKEKERER